MPETDAQPPSAAAALLAGAGMCLFALLAHNRSAPLALSAAGLGLTGVMLGRSLARAESPMLLLGLCAPTKRAFLHLTLGVALGAGLALAYRLILGWPPAPAAVHAFTLVAALIGAAEEVLYRGWLQGQLHGLGVAGAVAGTALLHAAYKSALFVLPAAPVSTDIPSLALWTVLGGLAFGALRAASGSVWPPLAAHALFDVIAYAEEAQAPWWVWS